MTASPRSGFTRAAIPGAASGAAARLEMLHRAVLALFIGIPLAALIAAVPVAWGWGLSWPDALIAVVMYLVTGHGITVGYHRMFTHRSFRAVAPVRVALAIAGSMTLQGRVIRWVADHRMHHRFSDRPGDRTHRGDMASRCAAWPAACSTRMSAGSSTRCTRTSGNTLPTCWPMLRS